MYLAFRQACTNDKYCDKTAHAQTDPHVCIWRELHLAGICACFDARAQQTFSSMRVRKQTFSTVLKYVYHEER